MSVSITPSIIAVQMTSSLQDISISVNNPSCVISFASGEYLPTDPTFNSLHVTTDAEIGDDLDVLGDQYVEGTLEVGSTLILDAGLLGTTADFTDVHLAGNITNVNAITLNTTPANVPTSVGTLSCSS